MCSLHMRITGLVRQVMVASRHHSILYHYLYLWYCFAAVHVQSKILYIYQCWCGARGVWAPVSLIGYISANDRNLKILVFVCKPVKVCFSWFQERHRENTTIINAFVTLFVLSFVKIISVSFDLLFPIPVYSFIKFLQSYPCSFLWW